MKNTKTNMLKRQSLLTIFAVAVIGLMIIPLTSCPDKADEVVITASPVTITVTLEGSKIVVVGGRKTLTLTKDQGNNTTILTAKVTNAYHTGVEWESDKTSVATVTRIESENTGTDEERIFTARVTAIAPGTAVIKVVSEKGPVDYCYLTVESASVTWDNPDGVFDAKVDEDDVTDTLTLNLKERKTAELKVKITQTDNKEVKWTATGDDKIVTVKQKEANKVEPQEGDEEREGEGTGEEEETEDWEFIAIVTAVNSGMSVITVKADDGREISCVVNVDEVTLTLEKDEGINLTDFVKGSSTTLRAIVDNVDEKDENNNDKRAITWSSSASLTVSVDQTGFVKALKSGNATITATTKYYKDIEGNPLKKTFNFQVPTATVKLVDNTEEENEITTVESDDFYKGKTFQLKAIVGKTTVPGVTWKSEVYNNTNSAWEVSEAVATVDANGLVTAKGAGTARITATTKDTDLSQKSCTVKVPAVTVTLNKNTLESDTFYKGKKEQLTATVGKTTNTDGVTWKSEVYNNTTSAWEESNAVATVNNGLVTAVGAGTARITATTVDTDYKTATCTVKVPEIKISLDKSSINLRLGIATPNEITLGAGELTKQLTATVEKTENTAVTWESDTPSVATVSNGLVTAVKTGRAKITAKASDDATKTKTCDVVVYSYIAASTSGVEMVELPGGTFMMGRIASEEGYEREMPKHEVKLTTGFLISKIEVTQQLYKTVTENVSAGTFSGENVPMETVSWYKALQFCNKLSELDDLSPAYKIKGETDTTKWPVIQAVEDYNSDYDAVEIVSGSTGYRLPTEAQWEYACRAGNMENTVADASMGWFGGALIGSRTHTVKTKNANAWGLFDMYGNVSELCFDWFDADYYTSCKEYSDTNNKPFEDPCSLNKTIIYNKPEEPEKTPANQYYRRVMRGGGWDASGPQLRAAYRAYVVPYGGTNSIGIRLVRPIPPPPPPPPTTP